MSAGFGFLTDIQQAVREIRRMEEHGELPHRNKIIALTGNARAGRLIFGQFDT